jgi:hypothetical protein
LKILKRDSGDEATDNATSSEKDGQQSHGNDLTALKSGFDDLQKLFDVLRKKFEHSKDITLLLRTEVSHRKDRLGDSGEEFADSEWEGGSDSPDHAVSFHEQDHSSLSGNKVDWIEKDEKYLNDLLEKDWTTLKFLDDQFKAVGDGETFGEWKAERDATPLVRDGPVMDKGSVSTGGADAAEPVSELDHPGKTRSLGQLRETTYTSSLQSPLSGLDQSANSRNQSLSFLISCPRCLKKGHELRACPHKAKTTCLLCCERWGKYSEVCQRQAAARSSMELVTCPGACK